MTTTTPLTLTTLNEIAVRLLVDKLGIANTARFINQFTLGVGDSVADKDRLFGQMTVAEIAAAIRQTKTVPTKGR
jgi:hypothetical protein